MSQDCGISGVHNVEEERNKCGRQMPPISSQISNAKLIYRSHGNCLQICCTVTGAASAMYFAETLTMI